MSKKIAITENNEELVNYVAKVRGLEFDAAANLLLGIGYSRISATMKYDQALKERGVKRTRSTKKAGAKKASKKAAKKAEGTGAKKASKKAAKSTKKAKDKKVKRKSPSPVLIEDEAPNEA